MNQLLTLYALYNQKTNEEITSILTELVPESRHKENLSFQGSVFDLYYHIIYGSWHYINAIRRLGEYDNKEYPPLPQKEKGMDFGEYARLLDRLNKILVNLAKTLPEQNLKEEKIITIYNGRKVAMSAEKFFLQHMTHQIHHQGQLSQIFDKWEIPHQFGNIFPLLPNEEERD